MARLDPGEGRETLEDREVGLWRSCHPCYEVSDRGRVRRVVGGMGSRVGRFLTPATNNSGYLYVTLSDHQDRQTRLVHGTISKVKLGLTWQD